MRTFAAASIMILVATGSLPAQQSVVREHEKQRTGAARHAAMNHESSWKEMDAFHKLLAATSHPVTESNNLTPLREKANDLAAAARLWSASKAPARCASEEIRITVTSLSGDALAIGNHVIARASDADLARAITDLHEKFEAVEMRCNGHARK
ncbi:MAG: hypothetical protein ACT4P7_18695 [Gemmatimonadaceae bacterium]